MSFDRARSPGYLANHLARLFAHHLATAIAPIGLAPAQFMTLLELWDRDGRTQADLVERLDVEQATMANTLRRMERDGLITRTPHPDDRRSQLISLTEKARSLEAPAKAAADVVNQRAVSDISSGAADQLIELMKTAVETLRATR